MRNQLTFPESAYSLRNPLASLILRNSLTFTDPALNFSNPLITKKGQQNFDFFKIRPLEKICPSRENPRSAPNQSCARYKRLEGCLKRGSRMRDNLISCNSN